MGKIFSKNDHVNFLVDELGFDDEEARKIVQSEVCDEDYWGLYAEMLNRVHANKKMFSRCFGRIDLSDQGDYTTQHRQWFEKAEDVDEVIYLKGGKCFFDHDIMVFSDGNGNSTVISVQSFFDCLVDDQGIKKRIEALYGEDRQKLYEIVGDFLGWHFETINWGYRDNA